MAPQFILLSAGEAKVTVSEDAGGSGGRAPTEGKHCKVPKFSDARKLCCYLPYTQTKRPNLRIFCQKDANGIANSEDPDQTAPLGA